MRSIRVRRVLSNPLLVSASLALMLPWLLTGAVGCARRPAAQPTGPVPANAFVKAWSAELNLARDAADRLFLRDDLLFLYTRQNRAYVFSATGGQLLAMNSITSPNSDVRPPVLLGDKVVYPTISTMEVYDRRGRLVASVPLERPTRSGAAAQGNLMYFGVDYPGGGRLIKYDLTRQYGKTIWELMAFASISAAPAVYEDAIYSASEDGRTFAVASDRSPIWPIDGNTFVTAGRITADLKVDDFGLYVASLDSKLYCLDRATGRIKWTYFAAAPLRDAPVVLADRVYQVVRGRGLVAINKLEGKLMRDPAWVAPAARQFLSADAQNVYVLARDGAIVALDKNTGEPKFRSRRRDLSITAPNPRDSTIYGATRGGEVVALRPVLQPGTVGELVLEESILAQPIAAADR